MWHRVTNTIVMSESSQAKEENYGILSGRVQFQKCSL